MAKTQPRYRVEHNGVWQVTSIERTAIFGLVRWWEKISAEKIGDELIIESEVNFSAIYLNGKKIK